MYTLLKSLSKYGARGVKFEEVEKWIDSDLITANDANKAYQQKLIIIKALKDINNLFSDQLDSSKRYVYLSKRGLAKLKQYNPQAGASYGGQKWQPEKRIADFLANYHDDD